MESKAERSWDVGAMLGESEMDLERVLGTSTRLGRSARLGKAVAMTETMAGTSATGSCKELCLDTLP